MSRRGSALLVCPTPSVGDEYAHSLEDEGFDVERTDRFDEALERFTQHRPDVLLLQADPESTVDAEKVDFLTALAPSIPLVVAVCDGEQLHRIEVHTSSGVQNLDGPFKPSKLMSKIVALSVVKAVADTLKRENERLRLEANIDQLTGVYNRRFLLEQLKHEIARSNRFAESFALLMIDLDNFKRFNDEFGHEAGDGVLTEVASFLAQRVRQVDTVARYGGDEFIILLAQASGDAAELVAERIRQGLEELKLNAANSHINPSNGFGLTASVGCYGYRGSGSKDLMSVINFADRALYDAKHAGGNRVKVFADAN